AGGRWAKSNPHSPCTTRITRNPVPGRPHVLVVQALTPAGRVCYTDVVESGPVAPESSHVLPPGRRCRPAPVRCRPRTGSDRRGLLPGRAASPGTAGAPEPEDRMDPIPAGRGEAGHHPPDPDVR